jgi:ferredoxin
MNSTEADQKQKKDERPAGETRLRRANSRKQTIELRPVNRGKEITDTLRTVRIDPDSLDLYSDVQPVDELVGAMKDKWMLVKKVEMPKWRRRQKLVDYGWGVTSGILKMDLLQFFFGRQVGRRSRADLASVKREIQSFAFDRGYICGFTRVDRRFIAEGRDDKFPYDTALVLGMEMDRNLLDEVPRPGDRLFDFETYVKSGRRVFEVARFIRSRGYKCYARVPFDGWVKYPIHAINAGLGELGANGVVITKEFGPRVRWTMISIDAEIEVDRPVDLNMAAYCDACRRCIRACPGKAIPEERVWWRGVLKRKINDMKCYPYFLKYEGCGICLKVCPIHRFGYKACMKTFERNGTVLAKASRASGFEEPLS